VPVTREHSSRSISLLRLVTSATSSDKRSRGPARLSSTKSTRARINKSSTFSKDLAPLFNKFTARIFRASVVTLTPADLGTNRVCA
jgi:hypothetical protein